MESNCRFVLFWCLWTWTESSAVLSLTFRLIRALCVQGRRTAVLPLVQEIARQLCGRMCNKSAHCSLRSYKYSTGQFKSNEIIKNSWRLKLANSVHGDICRLTEILWECPQSPRSKLTSCNTSIKILGNTEVPSILIKHVLYAGRLPWVAFNAAV
jgi:hypothetical protein